MESAIKSAGIDVSQHAPMAGYPADDVRPKDLLDELTSPLEPLAQWEKDLEDAPHATAEEWEAANPVSPLPGHSKWVTKDSGERAEFASGMVRDTDKNKPRFDLLIPDGVPYDHQMLARFAALMARGAEKYNARNWESANSEAELARFKSSAFRHFLQWFCGEDDEDHALGCWFNIMGAETVKWKMTHAAAKD